MTKVDQNKIKLDERVKNQHLIICFNIDRYSVLRYLYNEYNLNNTALNSRFWVSVMQVYYERIIIDLCKLYSGSKNDYYSFSNALKFIKAESLLEQNEITQIEEILLSCAAQSARIKSKRDEELAHLDKGRDTISVNLHLIDDLEVLMESGKKILILMNSSVHFCFENVNVLPSLQRIINVLQKSQI